MRSIKLTINYKSGLTLENIVNFVHFENGCIVFTKKNQISYSVVADQIKIPIEKIISFDIEETEQKFN